MPFPFALPFPFVAAWLVACGTSCPPGQVWSTEFGQCIGVEAPTTTTPETAATGDTGT